MDNQAAPETDIDKVPLTTLEQWGGQWRTLYANKRKLHDVSIKQIVFGQVFTLAFVSAISVFLTNQKEALLAIGTTLVIYPSLTDMLSSNAAAFSISVHHDVENLPGSKAWSIFVSTTRTLFIAMLASIVLGALGGIIGAVFFETPFLQTLRLAALSGSLAGIIGIPMMLAATFVTRRMMVNPDDVTAPLETTIFSSLTLVSIMIVSRYLV